MELVTQTDQKLLESIGAIVERLEERDLEDWFDHVALVFAQTGRGYFVDHYLAQPVLKYILVAKNVETNRILSTMRIFEHHIVLGNEFVRCAGVGEVSTHPDWRNKGLAGILLRALQRLMISEGFSVSSLHTSSVNFYSKFGYNLLSMEYVTATVQCGNEEDVSEKLGFQALDAVTPVWRSLYERLCDEHALQGIVLRNEEYWTNRIPKEVQRQCGKKNREKNISVLPLSANTVFSHGCGFQWIGPSDSSKCAVFLSAQIEGYDERMPVLKIVELIASQSLLSDIEAWRMVLSTFINKSVRCDWKEFSLKCPGAIWKKFVEPSLWSSDAALGAYCLKNIELSTSDGIMYKILPNQLDGMDNVLDDKLEPLKHPNHIFLPLDGF